MSIGVLGAGVMGAGIAEVCAVAGHRVVVVDTSADQLAAARTGIRRSLLAAALSRRERPDLDGVLGRISFGTDDEALREVDLVVENVTEDLRVKAAVHRRLGELCGPDVPIAVNTSAIPIGWLAGHTDHPGALVGTHFMNPVPAKPVVEVIRSEATSDTAFAAVLDFLRSIGKQWVVVGDAPGFVSNAILMAVVNSAAELTERGVADGPTVDTVFRTCFGHPMGPLETADLIGLDTVLRSLEVLSEFTGEPQYTPSQALVRRVAAGRLGRKNGEGFHHYSRGQG